MVHYISWFKELSRADIAVVGGKGANLGEMTGAGLPVPPGFVVTVDAYHTFIERSGLRGFIADALAAVNVDDSATLRATARAIQARFSEARIPEDVCTALTDAFTQLRATVGESLRMAVRSSATMEDTAQASFAGMNRSFLNVLDREQLAARVKDVWASLYAPRVIFYRYKLGLPGDPEIAVIVQQMIDADKSGVAFSVHPASGNPNLIVIEGAYGFGEAVVSGQVEPDTYEVAKADLTMTDVRVGHKSFMLTRDEHGGTLRVELPPEQADSRVLTDQEVRQIADLVRRDEQHYGSPQDTEWALAGESLYMLQSRPVTGMLALSQGGAPAAEAPTEMPGRKLLHGLGASPGVVSGTARVVESAQEADALQPGEVLVAHATSPDWVPFMRRAVAIVTDSGGMTSHAAIVSRELRLPCIVGTREATTVLQTGMLITVDGTTGVVTQGRAAAQAPLASAGVATRSVASGAPIVIATQLMVNLAEPERAKDVAAMPVDGVGLLRAEFMLLTALAGEHPKRLLEAERTEEFVGRMAEQERLFAEAFFPRPVVLRSMDFRTNEFRGLQGGAEFEPHEENPMIGFRGVFRYVTEPALFQLELQAVKRVRMEFPNLHLMLPFVRTGSELEACKRLIDESGLTEQRDFQLWIMAEVPSVVYWLEDYARMGIHGVSIGSNDLTQLVLGIDRDSDVLAPLFDERDQAVTETIHAIISTCRRLGLHSSICGQAPSVYPDYAETLVRFGIDSISVNADVIDQTRANIAAAEQRILLNAARSKRTDRDHSDVGLARLRQHDGYDHARRHWSQ
jgi:pyruvate,water dikinase